MEEMDRGERRATDGNTRLSHGRVGRSERGVTKGRTRERRRTSQSRREGAAAVWGGGRG